MTRRPILIGVATVLALALTAGLAYGAGRLVGTRGPANQDRRQQRVVGVVPGYFFGPNVQAGFRSGMGPGSRSRGWMGSGNGFRGWNMGWNRQPAFASSGRFAQNGNRNGSGSFGGYRGSGYTNHASGYPHHDHHTGSGMWANGSGYHHDDCCGWC